MILTQWGMYFFHRFPGGDAKSVGKFLGTRLGVPTGGPSGPLLSGLFAKRHPQGGQGRRRRARSGTKMSVRSCALCCCRHSTAR